MITVIITSFTNFGDYTTPLINSMRKFEKTPIELIIIDNGSKVPYPAGNYNVIRFKEPTNWARMLNTGAKAANGDWLCFLNDDVLCHGKFTDLIEGLDKANIYGPSLNKKPASWHNIGVQINYIPAWILVLKKSIYDSLGGMDEWYPKVGMDDIDFCWRAEKAGVKLAPMIFPFRHLNFHRRNKWAGFAEQMQKSIEYFIQKVQA